MVEYETEDDTDMDMNSTYLYSESWTNVTNVTNDNLADFADYYAAGSSSNLFFVIGVILYCLMLVYSSMNISWVWFFLGDLSMKKQTNK